MSTENFQLFNDFTPRKYVFAFFAFIRGLRAHGFLHANIENLLYTETGKDTIIVFLTTGINIFIAGLFFVFAPRILGPSDFGIFATVVATGILATNIANLGIDTGILKFASNGEKNNTYLALAFKSYLILGLATAIIGLFISPFLAKFLGYPQISALLRIAFVSTILLLFTNFYVAVLQARKDFVKASFVNISSNLSKLIILFIAAAFFSIGLYLITIIFFFTPIVSVIVGKIITPFKLENKAVKNPFVFFNYNLWVALALIVASIPLDNYFLLKLAGASQTGLYAVPFKILTFVYQFAGNFTRVLAPRFTSFDTKEKTRVFALKSFGMVAIMSAFLLALAIFGVPAISFVFGGSFLESEGLFRILTLGFIFFFAGTVPSAIVLYYLGKSQVTFVVTVIRFIVFAALLYILVPKMQAVGAAVSYSVAEGAAFLLLAIYSFVKLK